MKGSTQVVKGRIEEAAGALTGNDKLRARGQTDQAVGRVKQVAEKGVRMAKESARKIGETSATRGAGTMKGSTQVVKGRIEEAAGALTGNDKLRARGRTDQAVGRVKQTAEKGVRQARESARKIVDKARDVAQRTVDRASRKN